MRKILIIEDDKTIVEGLEDTLRFHDFTVFTAANGKEGIDLFFQEDPDLIILDIMLPGVDGFEVCRKLKQLNKDVPVIMLTARSRESEKLLGFELGADDYVTKPFSVKELIARVKAVLKRSAKTADVAKNEKTVMVGKAEISFKNFIVTREGTEYSLSPKECEILRLLVEYPDEVIDRDRIIDVVWGNEYFPSPRTIDNFILKLRNKIEDDPRNPVYILTVHGAGYKFKGSKK
ncbi:MAG: response regulator [Candidatus Aminicenantes bacterium]|nr:response regulator [Candidatus Aminicenantes bacterium]NIM77813.1 response regulator [Candidatus Aminicenantes bacterium]NIN17126.1 response regulator [Candidatus Aminicenantes bacterium]NIN41019.1 response regulator [Candidatus Aminicenantes bacterium]NIN83824.1 response regulator [Candidatus Aminicenantes bacterium]